MSNEFPAEFPESHVRPVVPALTSDQLMKICCISANAAESAADAIADFRIAEQLGSGDWFAASGADLRARTVTAVASGLGRLRRWYIVSFPFGYEGPQIDRQGWVKSEDVVRAAAQLVGILQLDQAPKAVAAGVAEGLEEAVNTHLMERKPHDAWRPGMRSGSGQCQIVSVTEYGRTKARIPVIGDSNAASEPALRRETASDQNQIVTTSAAQVGAMPLDSARVGTLSTEARAPWVPPPKPSGSALEGIEAKLGEIASAIRDGGGGTPVEELVTLSQASGAIGISKRQLERYLADGKLPAPEITGSGGRANMWYWSKLRPALEPYATRPLPVRFQSAPAR